MSEKKYKFTSWYNDRYLVCPKFVADPKSQDYTSYGVGPRMAEAINKHDMPPVPNRIGLPNMNVALWMKQDLTKEQREAFIEAENQDNKERKN